MTEENVSGCEYVIVPADNISINNNIKKGLREIWWGGMDLIVLA
jgi:hypothetical protein